MDSVMPKAILDMAVVLATDMRKRKAEGLPPHIAMRKEGIWTIREYADLTEQWCTLDGARKHVFLETMDECGVGYRVVDRRQNVGKRCPPVVSGPHDTLEAGKAAYLLALATL